MLVTKSNDSCKNAFLLMLLWNIGLALELFVFFITKLRILRGFFICSFPFVGICLQSAYVNEITLSTNPIFINTVFYSQSICIISALIYSANWICGSCQIIIYYIILSIFYILMPGNSILDKPFYIVLNIVISICLILTIYCFEYLHRKIIFTKLEVDKERNNLKKILDNIPNPMIITKNQTIIYNNKAFEEL